MTSAKSEQSARAVLVLSAAVVMLGGAPDGAVAQQQQPGPAVRARQPVQSAPVRPQRSANEPADPTENAAPDIPSPIPADDVSAFPQEPDDLDPDRLRTGQRRVLLDGDLADPDVPQLRDGVIDQAEPQQPLDGTDATTVDNRPREEALLFENAPSSVDQLLFQVEDLQPILDRRPQRLFRFEPYDPIGIKVGTFVLFPEAEFAGTATNNLFRSPVARSDVSFDVRPSARLVSNWRQHALEFRASGVATFHNEFPGEDDRAYSLETRGRLDISRRTNLQAAFSRDVAQESRSAPDGRTAGPRADLTTDKATFALNHRFNRLSVQLRGAVTDITYASPAGGSDNGARNYVTTEQAIRASWEFKPTLSAFSEVELNQRDYAVRDASGIDRSSTGERYRVGVSYGTTGAFLRGETSIGYGIQRPSSGLLPDVSGMIFDSNLTWRATALTSVAITSRSSFDESTTAGVGGVKTQSNGVEVRHAFQRYLIATAGLSYTVADYTGSSLVEDEIRATLGAEYFLNRETVLFGRYTHVAFGSTAANGSYDVDEARIGVRIRR